MTAAPVRWTRRAVTALFAGFLGWPHRRAEAQVAETLLQQTLLSLFENPDSACAVRRVCLSTLPHNARSLHSLETIMFTAARQNDQSLAAANTIRSRITHQISEDFASGSIVNIDGWHLSLTEAQLYALVAVNFPHAA
jgi:hypothetical protein